MTTKEKKYVFILTFNVNLGEYGYSTSESVAWSNNSELYYSDIQEAKKIVKNSVETESGYKAYGVVLINCTRILNDEYEYK